VTPRPWRGSCASVTVSLAHPAAGSHADADLAANGAIPAEWVRAISPMAANAQEGRASMTVSLDVFQTRHMAVRTFCYLAVFLVTVMTVRDGARLDRLAQVLVFSGVLQTVLGAVLFSLKADYRIFYSHVSHARLTGTYPNPDHLAAYLCMCLSTGVGLMLARLSDKAGTISTWRARAAR
jgi:heme A synthase